MKKDPFILALDQGTTSSRAILWNRNLMPCGAAFNEFAQLYPKPGWVEHDPEEIWQSQMTAIRDVLAQESAEATDLAALAIANQRETVVVWERESGRAIYPAIVWQCRRTAYLFEELKKFEYDEMIAAKTGLMPDPYFSASKIHWILENVVGARNAAARGELLAGTVDSWLVWKLSGGKKHVTDYTNASRTMLFNIHTLEWDEELLNLFDIPRNMLPEVIPSSGRIAVTAPEIFDGREIPILGMAGDQQAALFGQGCLTYGSAKNTYGTGCFLLLNTCDKPIRSRHGLITTLNAQTRAGSPSYALEGSVFMGGATIQWLRDELGIINSSKEAGSLASLLSDNDGVYLVPAFAGLGAPHWDSSARGILVGMTRGTSRNHIIRAAEEAIAYQCLDLVRAMEADIGSQLALLTVDGGAARDNFLMQFQADILGTSISRPITIETTARGAAALAALALGWHDEENIIAIASERIFESTQPDDWREHQLQGWRKALERAGNWESKL